MAMNKGKKFEEIFKDQWSKQFPGTFIFRLKDDLNGFKNTSQNPCDFLCLPNNILFMVECKSHKGSSIPFDAIPQYERLLRYKNVKNVFPVLLIWFIEKDKVLWVPISAAEKIYKVRKSIPYDACTLESEIIELPSEKLRVYLNTDYVEVVKKYGTTSNT